MSACFDIRLFWRRCRLALLGMAMALTLTLTLAGFSAALSHPAPCFHHVSSVVAMADQGPSAAHKAAHHPGGCVERGLCCWGFFEPAAADAVMFRPALVLSWRLPVEASGEQGRFFELLRPPRLLS